jgi:23S rRNA (pseudouridine1915-N3)-methyltransferase
MNKIRIISPGKIREGYLCEAVETARQALCRHVPVELVEVEDSPDQLPVDRALAVEADRMRARLKPLDLIVALDLAGQWPKPDARGSLNPVLRRWREQAQGDLVFLIGGSNGLDPQLLKQAQARICLSRLTFTHQMARLILLDLLERSWFDQVL